MQRAFFLSIVVLFTACAPQHRPAPPPPVTMEASRIPEPPSILPVTPPAESQFLVADSPDVQAAFDHYVQTGKAPVIDKKAAGFVQYPYGLSQPTVYCRPLELCDIELAPGEEILDLAAGDQERWVFQPLRSGPPAHRIVHVMAKPTDSLNDMVTTIVIGTNQRTYRIRLISRRQGAIVNVRFYYPQEMVQHLNTTQESKPIVAPPINMATVLASRSQYSVEGDDALRPALVGDDGTRTYLLMPSSLHNMDAPALFELSPSGHRTLLNYRLVDGTYTADKLFTKVVLVWGIGSDERTVTITRREP